MKIITGDIDKITFKGVVVSAIEFKKILNGI
jgi:hypothetical protein